uniref:Uncharacterized protein n=1 Tax=Meloidogyne enterolobii TaxID=390850 RepID=A0A6V7ULH3_MELEN|nr:unnamed protein product [Meloidogyne enterolobii]
MFFFSGAVGIHCFDAVWRANKDEKGISLDWITISQCKENTASTSIGKIFLNLRFYGPPSALMLGPKRDVI